jgi:hypothetical protein
MSSIFFALVFTSSTGLEAFWPFPSSLPNSSSLIKVIREVRGWNLIGSRLQPAGQAVALSGKITNGNVGAKRNYRL